MNIPNTIFLVVTIILSAMFWANACASLVRNYEKDKSNMWISKPAILIAGGVSFILVVIFLIIAQVDLDKLKQPEQKYIKIEEPLYKQVK